MTEPGLRERKKSRVREALLSRARALFAERGFDGVTVEELAAEAEVSRRTFFRYFGSKEELLFARRREQLERFRAALESPLAGEKPRETVARALFSLTGDYRAGREELLREQALVRASPALVAQDLAVDREFEAAIAQALARGAPASAASKRRARLAAAALVGAVRVCIDEWSEKQGRAELRKLGAEALALLEPVLEAASGVTSPPH